MGDIKDYFPRLLRTTDAEGVVRTIDESTLLATPGPKIVLGEPGMGKSELVRELGRRLDVEPLTAVHFMHSKEPTKFVVVGKPLLIDGLDEAMARRDGDAVDMILAQLEAAGAPDFILSCRAREWQARTANDLSKIYGAYPGLFALEALSRMEANAFLKQRYAAVDAEYVLAHLDQHGISDLYCNPLTLGLMGQVAEHDAQLPATRAALFERVCTLIWPEHDEDRLESGLGKITEDQALSAAGALMAGLLFAGADAISLAGPIQLLAGDVRLADLEVLPEASAARAVFSSKLFQTVGFGRAKPIHRVIAEFLGARWLANQAKTARSQRRLLAQLNGGGGVPASLKGLHAWLAHHSVGMTKEVIASDPFGVLRYGETSGLTSEQADCMFEALEALAKEDPFFRSQDWSSHPIKGLLSKSLSSKIETVIASADSSVHLRTLLIEGLKGSALARDLADTLELVLLSEKRFYSEREDVGETLLPYRDLVWWQGAIAELRDHGTEDSTRLARHFIEAIDCDVTDDLLVTTVLAEIGATICPLPRINKRRANTLRHYESLVKKIPTSRLINVLNLFVENVVFLKDRDGQRSHDLASFISLVVVRTIDEGVVGAENANLLWNWLGSLQDANRSHGKEINEIQARLNEQDELRRAIQLYALYEARPKPTLWMSELYLSRRMVGLAARPSDVCWFLKRLSGADNKDLGLRADWCDLMRLGVRHKGFDSDIRTISREFQAGDAQLEAFVLKLQNPKKQSWELRSEREAAKYERKRRVAREIHRREYAKKKIALRAGEFEAVVDPAKAYLGMFADLTREQPAIDRVVEWLGPELAADAMTGFESVLHRTDIPSPEDIATGFAEEKWWNYCFAIFAGLIARQHANSGFADLPLKVRMVGLLLCLTEPVICVDDSSVLCNALDASVIETAQDRYDFAKMWIEPSLQANTQNVPGLYKLAHDKTWHATSAVLAKEWLLKFSNLSRSVELSLVDCLTHALALDSLAAVASVRGQEIFYDENHRFSWLAIDILVRFETIAPGLPEIGKEHPEFIWHLRNRFQFERRGLSLPVSIAQAEWIISQFRRAWPYAVLQGSSSGDKNAHDATDFLRSMINRIATDTSVDTSEAMQRLIAQPPDSYTDLIRHMAAEQRQKRAEQNLAPLLPKDLGALLTGGPPSNADDLKSLVLEELAVAQKILTGDDLDQVRDFWSDAGVPRDENRCRDRLAVLIGSELMRYDVQRITEADMPKSKRADLAFSRGTLQLPMEVKGQWHENVWKAATDQLDLKYLIDWRSEQRGIYCVLWFGDMPSKSGRRLQAPTAGLKEPQSAEEMRELLISCIPEPRRALIDVVVLDLTAGQPLVG